MGCDIHTAVEFTRNGDVWELAGERMVYIWNAAGGGKGVEVSNWHICPPPDLVFELDKVEKARYAENEFEDAKPDYRRPIWHGRNYDLFAALAGVRNYDEITPMSEERGWPENLSEPLARGWPEVGDKAFDRPARKPWKGDPDLHTPSYFTLEELLLFDYSRVCGKSTFKLKRPVERTDFAPRTMSVKKKPVTYREYMGDMGDRFFADVEVLRRWADGRGLDASWVRVVFAFDN